MSAPPGHAMPAQRRWELACTLEAVRGISSAVCDFLLIHGCHADEARDCELALVEACNNAIQHSAPGHRQPPVIVEAHCEPRAVELRVTDHTPGFDWPERVTLPPPESVQGRGLYLMQVLMDTCQYRRGAGGNTLILQKQRRV